MDATLIGFRYELQDQLGHGGMGAVYRAYDRLSGEVVAIKRVLPQYVNTSAVGFRTALAQEFQVLATMRHPHIISVIDYGFDTQQHPYYAMELLRDAENLLVYAQHKPFQEKMGLLVQVLQALSYLHRRGMLHRDLKPDNILVTRDGQVKVLDFGLAIAQGDFNEETQTGGTLAYMPPEVLSGGSASFASDLHAFGVIAYEVISDTSPFDKSSMTELIREILTVSVDVGKLDAPDTIKNMLSRLLAKEPEDRYQDAEELLPAFTEVAGLPIAHESSHIRDSYLQAARFIGRTAELAQLTTALEGAQSQRGGLWLVGGESGVGKSRLIEELRTQALVNGVLVLRGQGIVEGGAPYLLWRNAVRYLCLCVALSDFEASVLLALVPDIGTLLRRDVKPAPSLDPDMEQTRLFNTLEAVFRRHTAPTLIIMEDLQWAQESLTLLKRMSDILTELPFLIVGTFRNDETPNLPEELAGAHAITLHRLNANEIAELSESILGQTVGRRAGLINLLTSETEGNAFFIVEIVRTLAEQSGQLSQIGQATIPNAIFAGGIGAVVQNRLRRVPEDAYALLALMAVAGREIDLKLAQHLRPDLDIDQWLLACNSVLDVLDNQWRFAHDKLREALIQQLDADDYQAKHAQVATAIEHIYPDASRFYTQLAYHWREAQKPSKEQHYATLAGKQALSAANYREAVRNLTRSVTLARETQQSAYEQAILTKFVGDAHMGIGQLPEAYGGYLATLAPLKHRSPTNKRQMYVSLARETLLQARFQLLPHRAVPEHHTDYWHIAATACGQLAVIHYFRNEKHMALYYALRGANYAQLAGEKHRDTLTLLECIVALCSSLIPIERMTRHYLHRITQNLPPEEKAGDRSWALLIMTIVSTNTAEWDTALPKAIECVALAETAGTVRRLQEAMLGLAAVHFFMSDWEKSYQVAERLLESALKYNSLQCQAWAYDDLGRVLYHRGDNAKALELFTKSHALYTQIEDTSGLIWVNGGLAQVHTRMGNLDLARPYAHAVKQQLLDKSPSNYGLLEGYQGLADFCLTQYEQTRTPEARAEAETAVMLMGRFSSIFKTGAAHLHFYTSWLASLNGQPALALREGKRAMKVAQRHGLRYEEGIAAYHLARFMPQSDPQRAEHMAHARSVFTALGATWELKQMESK